MKKIIGLLLLACCLNSYASGDSTTIPSIPDPTPPYPKYFFLPKFSYSQAFGGGAFMYNNILSPAIVVPRTGVYDIFLFTMTWVNPRHPAGYHPRVRIGLVKNLATTITTPSPDPEISGTVIPLSSASANNNGAHVYPGTGWFYYYLTAPVPIWGYALVYRYPLNMNDTVTAVITEELTEFDNPDVLQWAKIVVQEY